jgi:tetratricopeptide (TPR) repeat protein
MVDYNRRFSKKEFKDELMKHMSDMPPGFLKAKDKLEKHVETKAGRYADALAALDEAASKLKEIAASHPDDTARKDADAALKKIDEAIGAYGEASMLFNNRWEEDSK